MDQGRYSNNQDRWLRTLVLLPLLTGSLGLVGLGSSQVLAGSLDQQLAIPLNNGTLSDSRNQADRLVRLGQQQERSGAPDKAIASWLQALELYRQAKDYNAQAVVYDYLGATYARLGRMREAEDAIRRRLGVARDSQDFQGQIYALNNVGQLLLNRGSVAEAEKAFTEALTIARDIGNQAGEGMSLNRLGQIAYLRKNYNQAIALQQQGLSLLRFSSLPQEEAAALNNLGDSYQATADYREAAIQYRAALDLGKRMYNIPIQLRAIDGLVTANRSLQLVSLSGELLDRRLALAQEIQDTRQIMLSLRSLAQYYRDKQDYTLARALYQETINLARQLQDRPEEAALLTQLSNLPTPPR